MFFISCTAVEIFAFYLEAGALLSKCQYCVFSVFRKNDAFFSAITMVDNDQGTAVLDNNGDWRQESYCAKQGAKVSKEQEISVLIMENGDRDNEALALNKVPRNVD